MATFGDPGFHQHKAVGQYLSLLAFHLLDDQVLPIDVQNYAVELRAYRDDLIEVIDQYGATIDLTDLSNAIEEFALRAEEAKKMEISALGLHDDAQIQLTNSKYRDFQRGFVSQGGLPDREFFRHVVNAPGLDTGTSLPRGSGVTLC